MTRALRGIPVRNRARRVLRPHPPHSDMPHACPICAARSEAAATEWFPEFSQSSGPAVSRDYRAMREHLGAPRPHRRAPRMRRRGRSRSSPTSPISARAPPPKTTTTTSVVTTASHDVLRNVMPGGVLTGSGNVAGWRASWGRYLGP